MKVVWTLQDMNDMKTNHLRANIEYWKWDVLLEGGKAIDRIEKSRTLKVLSKASPALVNTMEIMKMKHGITEHDLDQVIDYKIDQRNNTVYFMLMVSNEYFMIFDALRNQMGKRISKIIKVFGRQELIDNFENEIMTIYTKDYICKILMPNKHFPQDLTDGRKCTNMRVKDELLREIQHFPTR